MTVHPPGLLARFPALLKAERARRGVAQRDLADRLGLNCSTLSRLEKGHGLCDVPTFLALVGWLGMSLPDFTVDGAATYQRGWDACAATVRGAIDGPEVNQ
jgi:transcriptional regulator with XRE-family HTH domain